MKNKSLIIKIALAAAAAFCLACLTVISIVRWSYRGLMDAPDRVDSPQAIIVLGAALKADGTPSDALADRLVTGVRLFQENKAPRILVTGDDGKFHTDEVSVMRQYLIDRGVSSSSILVDGQGYRTYESCTRAKDIFSIERAIVVTQAFHMPRALYLCNNLGIQTTGTTSDLHTYKDRLKNVLRDWLASAKAWWDINITAPEPPV